MVKKAYDKIVERYQADRRAFDHAEELGAFVTLLPVTLLPEKARVLDVGCGAGVPVTELLVDSGFEVVGIDFSENMLRLARENVSRAAFIMKDMTELNFVDNSFDGLTAFYSIIHVPREEHYPLFKSFHRILKHDGIMLVCMGPDEWEATE